MKLRQTGHLHHIRKAKAVKPSLIYYQLELVIDVIDRYYVDIKSTDPEIYEKYTGGDLQAVLDNLKYLMDCVGSEKVIVRIPIIQGLVNEEQQRQSKEYLKSFGVRNFDLFEYKILNEI